jgi:hypothetical protein
MRYLQAHFFFIYMRNPVPLDKSCHLINHSQVALAGSVRSNIIMATL